MKILISAFKAMIPKVSALLLGASHAQEAADCEIDSGDIVPLRQDSLVTTLALSGATIADIYLWRVGGSQYWLRFRDNVRVIRSPIADDAYSRIYWSGDSRVSGHVLYSYTPAVYTGGSQYPANYYKLGVPAPTTAPGAAVTVAPENPNEEVRYYVYTFVGKLGEEGPPSPPSAMVSVAHEGATVVLSDLVVPSEIGSQREISAINIYRTVTGEESAAFVFVGTILIAQSSFTDTRSATALSGVLATTSYDPPRQGMSGLGITSHGVAYGFLGKIVCFSELFLPYAWPRGYELTTFDDIVAIGHYDYHLIVGTNGRPVMITGQDPSSMSMQELPIVEACASPRSMVSMGWCAIYASPNGLVMATASGARLVTEGIFGRREWDAINPSSIHAYEYKGKYLFFWKASSTKKGGFIFDPRSPESGVLATSSWYSSGTRDITTDTLHLLDGSGHVYKWDGGTANRSATWRSRRHRLEAPASFSACRVRADTYDSVTASVYADGELVHSQQVYSDDAFRLPRVGRAKEWEVEVQTTDRVRIIGLAESVSELQR